MCIGCYYRYRSTHMIFYELNKALFISDDKICRPLHQSVEMPFNRITTVTCAADLLTFSASRFSSISFSSSLCAHQRYIGRPAMQLTVLIMWRSGTRVCAKFTMSRQPGTTTWGIPISAAAFNRSGYCSAYSLHRSSAISVVVISNTASKTPSRIGATPSFSPVHCA